MTKPDAVVYAVLVKHLPDMADEERRRLAAEIVDELEETELLVIHW